MAEDNDDKLAPLRRSPSVAERLEHVEQLVALLPKLSTQVADVELKIRGLTTHDEEQTRQIQRMADSFQQSVDQLREKFQESLEKQRAEHRRALEEQEIRWREAQERTERRWQEAQQRTIQEAVQQFGVLMARSISQRLGPWLWAIVVSGVSMLATYFWTRLTK